MRRMILPLFALLLLLAACDGPAGSPAPQPTVEPAPVSPSPAQLIAEADALDELGELYLQVLEDLWAVDPGLNDGAVYLGIDLTGLSHLDEPQRHILAKQFAQAHSLELLEDSWDNLCDAGYIDRDSLYWEDGIFFSIKTDEEATWNLPSLQEDEQPPELSAFDAHKWRSALGAYFFGDCAAQKWPGGAWSYSVGHEAIS